METLTAENAAFAESVKSFTKGMTWLSEEKLKIKETVIKPQVHGTRAERNGLQRKRPVSKGDPGATLEVFFNWFERICAI